MKIQTTTKPPSFDYEVINNNQTALMRFYANIAPYTRPVTDDEPAASGWEADRYTLMRPHSEELRAKVEANIALWCDYARQQEHEELALEVRIKRNALLAESDWTQLADAPLSADEQEAYRLYRQALRDITEREEFPYVTQWPEKPEA